MKALIFAAGKGMRLRPYTNDRPKPLIEVGGKPLLQHVFEALPEEIESTTVVVGYKGDMVREYLRDEFLGKKVSYVFQEEALGTGHALQLCRGSIKEKEKFLVVYADNLYGKRDLERFVASGPGILVRQIPGAMQGVVTVDADDNITGIVEWPESPISDLVVTGVYLLDSRIWDYDSQKNNKGEYYINDMLRGFIRDHGMRAVRADFWMPVGTNEELVRAERFALEGR